MWNNLKAQWAQQLARHWWPFWTQLQPREQQALKLLTGVLILAVGYFSMVQPIFDSHRQAEVHLQKKEQQWVWMVKQATKVEKLQGQVKQVSQLHLNSQSEALAQLQQAVRQHQLNAFLQQMRPVQRPIKGIALRFKSANADRLFQLLDSLEQQGWVADKIEMQVLKKAGRELPGVVDAQLIFPAETQS